MDIYLLASTVTLSLIKDGCILPVCCWSIANAEPVLSASHGTVIQSAHHHCIIGWLAGNNSAGSSSRCCRQVARGRIIGRQRHEHSAVVPVAVLFLAPPSRQNDHLIQFQIAHLFFSLSPGGDNSRYL